MPNVPKFVIGMEPKEAIEFLRQKKMLAGKVFTKELHDSALAKATTIARLSSLEMTKDIYQSLETAIREGKGFNQWKKDLLSEFERKGWVFGKDKSVSRGIDGNLLADPKTGEYFGTPRRLNTIYRVNMQSAYSAARYQRMRDNVDNRPYWQYSAVGDERTRPAHLALSGKIYRYDDPFWVTFYPPNGFNCRCSVIALSDRDLKRRGMDKPDDSSEFLVEVERPADKLGNREKTVGFKLSDGTVRVTDKGFDYNVGRLNYKPNLDLYPEKLAHQFAKVEMSGAEFKLDYAKLSAYLAPHIPHYLSLKGRKPRSDLLQELRDKYSRNFKFAAGVLNEDTRKQIGTELKTIWFSDDSMIKQIANRYGQFGVETYEKLPDVLNSPDEIKSSKGNHFEFYKTINGERYMAVVKILEHVKELYMQSFRRD
ncbi:phage minor head protein [Haemophilus haemolyticus]|uniref:phage minor head protein n=1 Tax=Haemophilus haemolyticus TaxID=726 RepID=UPI000E59158D|nr:phage minor head protein [Haemophilus haemolyticus]